jgi:sigma-B regulation protein RsbU (phosphoserine phosphatase)
MDRGWKKYIEFDIRSFESNGFYPMLTIMLALFGLYLFFSQDPMIYTVIKGTDTLFVKNLLRMMEVVLYFIVFYMCYLSFETYRSTSAEIYTYTFLVVACLEMVFTVKFHLEVFSNPSEVYTTFSMIILSLGMLYSSIKDLNEKNETVYNFVGVIFTVSMITVAIAILFTLKPIHEYFRLSTNIHIAKIAMEYFISGLLAIAAIFNLKHYYENQNQTCLSLASGLIVMVFAIAFRMNFEHVSQVGLILPRLYSCIALVVIARALYVEQVSKPFTSIVNAENQIKLYADNLEKIITKRTTEIKEVNTRLINELEYAKRIQQSLLPLKKLSFKNAIFMSEYFPCERLSGDFYDIYRIDDENIGMYVLDVSGHGISAALMTMFCNNYIKSTERLIKRYRGLKPHRNLRHFYEEFNKMNFPEEMHMVIFFASYNISTRMLTYCSGGMNCYPIVVKRSGEVSYLEHSTGFPICKMSDFFTPEYISAKVELEAGDRVIFYTDGLIDEYKNGTMDEDELVELAVQYSDRPLKEFYGVLKSKIDPLVEDLEDDITYFIMEV